MSLDAPPEIVAAARAGDVAQIERLIATVWPGAYRLATAVAGDRAVAEEAAQDACVALYRTIGTLRSVEAFRVWFSRIVVREASAAKRRNARAAGIDLPCDAAAAFGDADVSIDVWSALATLPGSLRDVVVLRYFEDLNSREIAEVLAVPSGTVRFRLMVAMRRLRPLLGQSEPARTAPLEVRPHAI